MDDSRVATVVPLQFPLNPTNHPGAAAENEALQLVIDKKPSEQAIRNCGMT